MTRPEWSDQNARVFQAAMNDDPETAGTLLSELAAQYGPDVIPVAAQQWVDTFCHAQGITEYRADNKLTIGYQNADTPENDDAPDAVAWCGALVDARVRDDPKAWTKLWNYAIRLGLDKYREYVGHTLQSLALTTAAIHDGKHQ